jgi:hypothetical protein
MSFVACGVENDGLTVESGRLEGVPTEADEPIDGDDDLLVLATRFDLTLPVPCGVALAPIPLESLRADASLL